MPLFPKDLARLVRLLAMFSSDFDGEVVSAARAAERLVKQSGETWDNIINAAQRGPAHQPPPPSTHSAEVGACLSRKQLLTDWEVGFLISIAGRKSLSKKQWAMLDLIKAKLSQYADMQW